MEIYRRKILSNRVITSIDTDGDGQDDAITLAQLTPVNVQFYLKENIDNMGLFTDFIEEVEVIDIDNIWDLTNDGAGDGGTSSNLPDLTNPYDDDTISTTGGVLPAYCTHPDADNYFQGLSQSQINALGNPYDSGSNPAGTWVPCVGCCDFGTGFDPGGGFSNENDPILWTGTTTGTVYNVRKYNTETNQSCWNQWGGHDFLPIDCGGTSEGGEYMVTSQCGYPQALHTARVHCNQSTEDGAAAGDWSLLEYTLESNDSYAGVNGANGPITATGGVPPETTDTAPFPSVSGTPPFGGPEWLSTQDPSFNAQYICWNEMTTGYKQLIRNNMKPTWPGDYLTAGNPSEADKHPGAIGPCNNCKLNGTVGSGTGRCVDNTNIINGIPFRWLNYPQSGKGCGSSKFDCNAEGWPGNPSPGYERLYNNPTIDPSNLSNGSWDIGSGIFLQDFRQIGNWWNYFPGDLGPVSNPPHPTVNNCGHEKRYMWWWLSVAQYDADHTFGHKGGTINGWSPYVSPPYVLFPKMLAHLYVHNFSFNCKKQN